MRYRTLVDAVRAALRTGIFLLKVLPMLPSAPVNWVTPAPAVKRVSYPTTTGLAEGDLYQPSVAGRVPGIVVCLGVVPFGVDHPQVARLGEALARSGFAALLFWSPAMRDRRLDTADAGNLARAYQWLVDQPCIDPSRSGLLGTCVGGSVALMASIDPRIRDRVAFLAAFAPYSSMWTFAKDIASSTRELDGPREPWAVDSLTRDVFLRTLLDALEPEERELFAPDPDTGAFPPSRAGQSVAALAVRRLLDARNAPDAAAALDELPAEWRARVDALSPLPRASTIAAPLIVIGHDHDDAVVPVSESRQLIQALAGRVGVSYTEFHLFKHATPRHLAPLPLLRELIRFARYLYPLFALQTAGRHSAMTADDR